MKIVTDYNFLHTMDVRKLCIENGFYTRGTNEEYDAMFDLMRHKNVTDDLLLEIAVDIAKHSNNEYESETAFVEELMFMLSKLRLKSFKVEM